MNELSRKLIHLCGLFVPILYLLLEREKALLFFGALLLLALAGEFLRSFIPPLNNFFLSIFSGVTREYEKERILGATYFSASAFLAILLFPQKIAVACMLYLILGDTVAALVGKKLGRHRFRQKSLEGSLAFLVVSFLSSLLFFPPLLSLIGAISATATEAFSSKDNLTIPLVSGAVLYGIHLLFSG